MKYSEDVIQDNLDARTKDLNSAEQRLRNERDPIIKRNLHKEKARIYKDLADLYQGSFAEEVRYKILEADERALAGDLCIANSMYWRTVEEIEDYLSKKAKTSDIEELEGLDLLGENARNHSDHIASLRYLSATLGTF